MNRMSRHLAAAALVLASAGEGYTWGPDGHAVVARVAHQRLTPQARAGITHLLGHDDLAAVAMWADDVRHERPDTAHWHFVDIPIADSTYRPERDCAMTPIGDCLIAALERTIRVLRDTHRPVAARAEALKFVVHLVADLHQPLHCADNTDHGGNDIPVQWFREPTNLHRVWDSGLLQKTGLRDQDLARFVEAWLSKRDPGPWEHGTIVEWALETHRIAVAHVYGDLPKSRRLTGAYYDAHIGIVDQQLAKAAVRLARLLNDSLAQSYGGIQP